MVGYFIFLLFFQLTANVFCINQYSFQQELSSDKIVVKSERFVITADEFINNYLFGPASIKNKIHSKESYLNFMIYEKLLASEGYERKVDTTERFQNIFNEIKSDLMTEEFFKDEILSKVEVTDKEIDQIVVQKQLELTVKWLYAKTEAEINKFIDQLDNKNNFDSLFMSHLNDSIFVDSRSLKMNRYQLGRRNPEIAQYIDTLEVGKYTKPIKQLDGYYILKLANISQNNLVTETEQNKLYYEAERAIRKGKMDSISDQYVHNLLLAENPVIKRNAFNILKGYLGRYELSNDKYSEWQLQQLLDTEKKKIGNSISINLSNLNLITLKNYNISLGNFLNWYWNRSQYITLEKESINSYSKSLENLIWRMVRDRLLTRKALEKNYDTHKDVLKQELWWKDKIIYSIVKEELANSILLKNEELVRNSTGGNDSEIKTTQEKLENEFNLRLLKKIEELKRQYKYTVDQQNLNKIQLPDQDQKSIEFYGIKKGGLIPRTPYPTLDREWESFR